MSARGPWGAALACAICALAGCGATTGAEPGARLRATEQDFAIHAPRAVRAGTAALSVHNSGPDRHDLTFAGADAPRLPLRSDGMTVDEDSIERRTVGSV